MSLSRAGRVLTAAVFCLPLTLALPPSADAQEIRVVERRGETFQLLIDGRSYVALTERRARDQRIQIDSLTAELRASERRNAANDTLIQALERTNSTYSRHIAVQDSLVSQTMSLYEGYRDLYFDYKSAFSEPWLYFSGGIGAVRDDEDNDILPVLLLGVAIRRLALWGFLNTRQSGFIIGINQPIRFSLF